MFKLLSGFEERKYRCAFDGCLKTYKNQQGLRFNNFYNFKNLAFLFYPIPPPNN